MATNAGGNPSPVPAGEAEAPKVKTDKELERERKKAEKMAKFEQKKNAKASATASGAAGAGTAGGEKKAAKAKAPKVVEEPLPAYVNDTPAGEKKHIRSFDDPHYKSYNPVAVESAWYEYWEKSGFFKPRFGADGKELPAGRFVISHPPPNVTGSLHMGHALGDSLQDIMIRYNRMKGKTTLWLPGCDHAGIATQSVVETMLYRKQGKTRHDLGREQFIKTVWDWKTEYHNNINNALRKMGGSFDWSREAFTMDENLTAAVQETFVRLHEEGTIFRANRLVNWDSKLNTALSNLEVNNKDLPGRTLLDVPGYTKKVEFGVIHHFKYKIEGSDETIEVATTRIETMLGDTGIAVHPKDERYTHLIGRKAVHPFIEGRLLPIVADDYVDREFGTGAVKITPAHDANDFAIGERHNLEFINILTDDGLINEFGGPYAGLKRFDVRYTITEDLKKAGLYVEKKDNPMVVPLSERSKDIVEPRLKPQWWMRMGEMSQMAVDALDQKKFKIKPESAERNFRHWMANITDWCISRQLWWGHQCPVYLAHFEGENESDPGDNGLWFAAKTEAEALAKAQKAFPDKKDKIKLVRDEDVLDTWFSSGLWPFSTLGWPKETEDLAKLFPTSVLETGWDILFFWIARMVMLSLKLTGKVPFYEVYCHPLVRDSDGRKMSKSLGNVINPLDVISGISLESLQATLRKGNLDPLEVEKATKYQKQAFPNGIPECGADGLRMCLANYVTESGDINFDIKVMHAYRRFCNKIWNASKFVLGNLASMGGSDFKPREKRTLGGHETLPELWILHKMNKAAKDVSSAVDEREFKASSNALYNFWYSELCDVFIENSKSIISSGTPQQRESALQTLYSVLESALLLSHPFLPFITEELWQRLPRRPSDTTPSIVVAAYPEYEAQFDNPVAETAYQLVLDSSRGIRSLSVEYPMKEYQVYIQTSDEGAYKTVTNEVPAIKSLIGKTAASTTISTLAPGATRPAGCVALQVSGTAVVFLHVKGHVDLDAEIGKAQTKLTKAQGQVAKTRKLINDAGYKVKVAAATQEADKKKLAEQENEIKELEETVAQFESLKLE